MSSPLSRWVTGDPEDATPEGRAGTWLRDVPEPFLLPDATLQRLKSGIDERLSGEKPQPRWSPRWLWALAAVMIILTVGAVGFRERLIGWMEPGPRWMESGTVALETQLKPRRVKTRFGLVTAEPGSRAALEVTSLEMSVTVFGGTVSLHLQGGERVVVPAGMRWSTADGLRKATAPAAAPPVTAKSVAPPVEDEAPTPAPAPEPEAMPEPEAKPEPRPTPAPSAKPSPDPAPRPTPGPSAIPSPAKEAIPSAKIVEKPAPPSDGAEDPLEAESRLLATALKQLRQDCNAGRALETLDDYRRRFPEGALRPEARLAEIDALLQLGRRARALVLLDPMAISGTPRGRELHVLRGELRADAGRCQEAIVDFTAGLAGRATVLDERALYGRASCRSRLKDSAGARDDLRQYLTRFPKGRFADPVKKALAH